MSCDCESDVTTESVLRCAPSVSVEDFDGEFLAYDDTAKELHAFNRTASLLWQCLDGESPLAEIIEDLADAFGAPLGAVTGDVLDAAGGWRNRGLVELLCPDGGWDRKTPRVAAPPPPEEPCVGCAEENARRRAEQEARPRAEAN